MKVKTFKKDWFKLKKYPHIGFPITTPERKLWVEDYITDPIKISKHSFLPFIHKCSAVRKFRKKYSEITGEVIKEINDGKLTVKRYPEEKKEISIYLAI